MSYVKVGELLRRVDIQKTSAIALNCADYDMAYAAVMAAEELQKPVILALYPLHSIDDNAINLSGFAAIGKELGESVDVPVAIHLDHCSDMNYILKAIESGFTSVMYDGSELPFEENAENTKKVVRMAAEYGVDVEAELGHVGVGTDDDHLKADRYTKAEDAALFAKETGITSLAIDIGSAHGVYKEEPKLDLVRLAEINKTTDIPLVLHGGSGIPFVQLEDAFRNGINKFNVGTNYFQARYDAMLEYCEKFGRESQYYPVPRFVQGRLIAAAKELLNLTSGTYR